MYGSKITQIRLARGLSQENIANQIGISQSTYSKIENGETVKLEENVLEKIAEALGVSVEDIKSPIPIIMHFQNSPNSGFGNSNLQNTDILIIESLLQQIKEKDTQIEKLLALLERK